MYEQFAAEYRPDPGASAPSVPAQPPEWITGAAEFESFMSVAAFGSFDHGLLRFVHAAGTPNAEDANGPAGWLADWANARGRLWVFAYDWLGRLYGFDRTTGPATGPESADSTPALARSRSPECHSPTSCQLSWLTSGTTCSRRSSSKIGDHTAAATWGPPNASGSGSRRFSGEPMSSRIRSHLDERVSLAAWPALESDRSPRARDHGRRSQTQRVGADRQHCSEPPVTGANAPRRVHRGGQPSGRYKGGKTSGVASWTDLS